MSLAAANPKFCGNRNTATRMPCRRRVLPDTDACSFHADVPPLHVRRAAREDAERLEQSASATPIAEIVRRPIGEIVSDALAMLDHEMTAGGLKGRALVEHADRLIRSCKILLDSGVSERMVAAHERDTARDGRMVVAAVVAAVDAALDHVGLADDYQRVETRRIALDVASRVIQPEPTPVHTIEVAAIEAAPSVVATSHPSKRLAHTATRSPRDDVSVTAQKDQVADDDTASFDVQAWADEHGVTLPPGIITP